MAQQLAQAEAAALAASDGIAVEEGGEGADFSGEPGGATDLLDGGDEDDVAAGMDAHMMDEEGEHDLDNDVPDADAADFSFGNNDDQDDPFASSSEGEDEVGDDEDEDAADDEGDENARQVFPAENDSGDRSISISAADDAEGIQSAPYPHGFTSRRQQVQQDVYVSAPTIAAAERLSVGGVTTTRVLSIEEQRAQARARAAERREMRQMRAAEDRMRALRAHPRLSGAGMTIGMGMFGEDEDLDEEDQAQMLQEDDLVRVSSSPNTGAIRQQQQQQGRRQSHRQRWPANDNDSNIARGNLHNPAHNNSSSFIDERIHQDGNADFENEDDVESGLEMDMDADLDDDGGVNRAMYLSAFDDEAGEMDHSGSYEHTDTEAELSSSVVGLDDNSDEGHHLPQHNFLTLAGIAPGSGNNMSAPRSSGIGVESLGQISGHGHIHGRVSGVSVIDQHHQRLRSSLARSDRNSMDISSLLSQDGSSAFGSSPQLRRL